jgi:hypothetical protein
VNREDLVGRLIVGLMMGAFLSFFVWQWIEHRQFKRDLKQWKADREARQKK